jgi:C-terminal processing protease CtpA/Prc
MTIDRQKTLDTIKALIATKHVNVERNAYANWTSMLDQLAPELITASELDFQETIHSSLAQLRTSHTAFLKPDTETIPLRYALCATMRKHSGVEGERWVFQDVLEDGPADLAGIKAGDVLISKDGTTVSTSDPPLFGFGGTYNLTLGRLHSSKTTELLITIPNKVAKDRPPMIEPKALSFAIERDQLPVIKVNTFPGAVGLPFVRELDNIIDRLTAQNRDRLIIDLRGNIGGGLASLRLMSYLCSDRRPIGYSLTKQHIQKRTPPEALPRIGRLPQSKAKQLTMFVRFRFINKDRSIVLETEGLGSRPFHSRIVMLINEHTHSAAEMVAAFAKENHLATLVGTTTAGEVMGGANYNVGGGYRLRIPVTTWQTWNGMHIEGCGVEPDVIVDFSPEACEQGHDLQLEKAVQLATNFS